MSSRAHDDDPQTLPDWFTFESAGKRTELAQMIGNAVPPGVFGGVTLAWTLACGHRIDHSGRYAAVGPFANAGPSTSEDLPGWRR